ncbi:MAG: minor capsid protein [Bdellovibrionota bacterium]
MALYNIHKRKTLDRLTLTYQLRMREVLRQNSEKQVREFLEALDAGRTTFDPDLRGLRDKISPVFESHREKVIHVAVSDGIQEISPDHELGLWERFPLDMPVEDTLGIQLASERDKIVRGIKKATIAQNTFKVKDLADSLLDRYLSNLKKTYKKIAASWLEGESTIEEVLKGLKRNLQRTDSESEMLFRTETTNYFNESRHDYFESKTAVDYMELYAVTDGRISKICEDRHGAVVTIAEAGLKKYMPAFHPHCRTIQRPLISALSSHKKIVEAGLALRASYESTWVPTAWDHSHAA